MKPLASLSKDRSLDFFRIANKLITAVISEFDHQVKLSHAYHDVDFTHHAHQLNRLKQLSCFETASLLKLKPKWQQQSVKQQ